MGYSTIDDAFWTDLKLKKLTSNVKLVFFWLITNPTRHYSGLYTLYDGLIEGQTGLKTPQVESALQTLEKNGFVKVDKELGIVWVVNMFKYQTGRATKLSPQQLGGLKKHLLDARYVVSDLVWFFCRRYEYLGVPQLKTDTPIHIPMDTPYGIGIGNLNEESKPLNANIREADSLYKDESLIDKNGASTPVIMKPQDLIALYNDINPHDRKQDILATEKRKDKARVRLMQFPDREFWMTVFHKVKQSGFLRCTNGNRWNGGRGADLDWLILNDTNPAKVWEGKYDDSGKPGGGESPDPYARRTHKTDD